MGSQHRWACHRYTVINVRASGQGSLLRKVQGRNPTQGYCKLGVYFRNGIPMTDGLITLR